MESEVVVHGRRSNTILGRLRRFHPSVLLYRLVSYLHLVNSGSNSGVAEERVIGRALTFREQAAYHQHVNVERETEQSILRSSRESLDRTYSDLKRATEFTLSTGIEEGRLVGHAYHNSRRRTA